MSGRRLGPDEQALWDRVAASVRPLAPGRNVTVVPMKSMPAASPSPGAPAPVVPRAAVPARSPGGTLDGGWDRALRRGGVMPDMVIALHGHLLAAAHAVLDHGLVQALAQSGRVVLLVTSRPTRECRRRGSIHTSSRD